MRGHLKCLRTSYLQKNTARSWAHRAEFARLLTASPLAPARSREEKRMKFLAFEWRWWHAIVAFVIALAGCSSHGGAAPEDAKHEEDSEAHVAVKTEPARLGVSTTTVEGLGRCEALPDHIATLTPAVEGHVHELLVAQGDRRQERAADRRARYGGRAAPISRRRRRLATGSRRRWSCSSRSRGAEERQGQRAGDRAGQGGGGPGQGGRRSAPPAACSPRGLRATALRRGQGPRAGRRSSSRWPRHSSG